MDAVSGDKALIDLLEKRCAALIRLHERRAYIAALKRGNYGSVAFQILKRPHLARDLAHSIRRRLGVA